MEINKVYNEDCLVTMGKMPDNFVDLTITSPPYDNLRNYNGYSFEFEKIAKELYRITKNGGIVVWVVGDSHDKNGSETLTSFKQAIFFKEIGFNIHDTMIYQKNSYPFPPINRYYQQFEYMFVLSKQKPKTFNIQTQKTLWKKNTNEISTTRQLDGTTKAMKYKKGKEERKMDNVWALNTGYMRTTKDKIAYNHPAIFPEELCERHIISWSNEGDLVYDCFMGSGTTAKMSIINSRNWVGSEISSEYCDIINKRISDIPKTLF
jgi:site-specific DNA-methyltransferase (adenine-specific)